MWRQSTLFAILQKYDFSSKSQLKDSVFLFVICCLRYCKSTIFQANHNWISASYKFPRLFAILQKYDFSSKSQRHLRIYHLPKSCLRYCKSTIFQANHNPNHYIYLISIVVCDTAKVRFFKQITTIKHFFSINTMLFAILQKYDFSSKSQRNWAKALRTSSCLRYCKSTIFQANHNTSPILKFGMSVVCDTAKVRFFKQITTAFPPFGRPP